jgi:hypothetical protein
MTTSTIRACWLSAPPRRRGELEPALMGFLHAGQVIAAVG